MEIIFFIIAVIFAVIRSNNSYNRGAWYDEPYRYRDMETGNYSRTPQDPVLGIVAFIIVLILFWRPIVGLILIPFAILGYRKYKNWEKTKDATVRRKEVLLRAKVFLSPYKDIWKNLTLSNKYCSLRLKCDGKTIVGTEKKADSYEPYRTFRVTASNTFDINELWNLFCLSFDYNHSYDGLLTDCERFHASIYEDIITPELPKPKLETKVDGDVITTQIDINNSSEAELTALPGISIVIAKKIIKKREEIGGFKNIEDFLNYVKLKPNVMKQLKPKICVNKMKGSLKITRSSERTLDL